MPQLLPIQFAKILYGLTQERTGKELDEATKVFAEFVKSKQALKKMSYITKEFTALVQKKEGKEPIHIVSAKKVSEEVKKEIASVFGKDLQITQEIDPSLIGGLKIKQGNTIFDTSIISQLKQLKQELI